MTRPNRQPIRVREALRKEREIDHLVARRDAAPVKRKPELNLRIKTLRTDALNLAPFGSRAR